MRTPTARLFGRSILICLALLLARGAWAAEVSPAERLHQAAVQAYKRGNLRQAVELWSDALRLEAKWKYAYNLGNVQYERGEGLAAWAAVTKAEALGPPAKHVGIVAELKSKVRALLFKDHALLVVAAGALPPGSVVKRGDERLEPPYEVWTKETSSAIVITADGFETYSATVPHPIGERTDHTPKLVPKSTVVASTGRLALTGTAGAKLTIEGNERGTLPLEPIELPVGSASIRLELKGYVTEVRQVTIAPDQVTALDVPLVREVIAKPPAKTDLAMPGWILVGSGVVAAAVGSGLLVWAGDAQDELENLNKPEVAARFATYDDYAHRFEEVRGAMDDRALGGTILIVAGGAAVVTGVALILLDEDDPAPGGVLGLVPITGGAALVGGAKF